MKTTDLNNNCSKIRAWIRKAISSQLSLESDWIQKHISNCRRCQRRMAHIGKVNLALSIMKSQPHSLDLLMRANRQAIGVLKHSLRHTPKAQKLKTYLPRPKLLERCGQYAHCVANVAACIAALLFMKAGVSSSVDKFQKEGQKVIKQYYASHVGKDLTDEIFPNDSGQSSPGKITT